MQRFFIVLALLRSIACGVNPGVTVDEGFRPYVGSVPRVVALQAQFFRDSSWPDRFSDLEIHVTSYPDPLERWPNGSAKLIGQTTTLGRFSAIKLYVREHAAGIDETAFVHELTHVYCCNTFGDCDNGHDRLLWVDAMDIAASMRCEREHRYPCKLSVPF